MNREVFSLGDVHPGHPRNPNQAVSGQSRGRGERRFTRPMKVVLSGKLHQVHIGREDEGGDRQKTEESPGKTPTETGGSQVGEKCLCLA